MSEPDWVGLVRDVAARGGPALEPASASPVGGGCINRAFRLRGAGGACFVKLNDAAMEEMFHAEADGLRELASAGAVRVPAPLAAGRAGNVAYLLLEWIDLIPGNGASAARLGERLAALHRVRAPRFGWHRDNTLGSTPQPNAWAADWVEFLRERRIGWQLRIAARKGHTGRLQREGERLLELLPQLFEDYEPSPSLLHGDLWGGNWQADEHGEPVIFDPAVHYGDRESDLAMTELFGGFGRPFYAAYRAAWPVADGYALRRELYQLYHLLNHLNLFGGGYLAQVQGCIDRLLCALA